AVDGGGTHFGRQGGRQVERDAAVHGAEVERVAPGRTADRRHDRAVHRLRFGVSRRRDPDATVYRVRIHVAREVGGFYLAVDRVPGEPDARGHAHGEIDPHVV